MSLFRNWPAEFLSGKDNFFRRKEGPSPVPGVPFFGPSIPGGHFPAESKIPCRGPDGRYGRVRGAARSRCTSGEAHHSGSTCDDTFSGAAIPPGRRQWSGTGGRLILIRKQSTWEDTGSWAVGNSSIALRATTGSRSPGQGQPGAPCPWQGDPLGTALDQGGQTVSRHCDQAGSIFSTVRGMGYPARGALETGRGRSAILQFFSFHSHFPLQPCPRRPGSRNPDSSQSEPPAGVD